MNQPRDFDVGVARRLSELESSVKYLKSIIVNPGLSQGSFTPEFVGSTGAGVFTYSSQVGSYRVTGDLVTLWGTVSISAIPTPPTGTMRIDGLPFTAAGNTSSAYFGGISNVDFTAGAIQLIGDITGTGIRLIEVFDSLPNVLYPAAQFDNFATVSIRFAGFYQKA